MLDMVGKPKDRLSRDKAHCLMWPRVPKVPKFLNARNFGCNQPKIQTKRPNLKVFCQKDANGIANSEYPDQS